MINRDVSEKRIAIFDLDGTLVDSDKMMSRELIETFKGLGVSPSEEEINIEGKRDKYALSEKYGFSSEELDRSYRENVKHIYTLEMALRSGDVALYPETLNVLKALEENGVVLGLLPRSARKSNVLDKVQHLELEKYFGDRINIVSNGDSTKHQGALNLVRKVKGQNGRISCIGDRAEDVTIADDLRDNYEINAQGIYVHRSDSPDADLTSYKRVKTLDEIPELVLAK